MMRLLLAVCMCLALPLAPAGAKMYSETCGEAKCIEKILADRYHEVPVGMGLRQDGVLIRLFENKITAKWSIVRQAPDGSTCIIMHGTGWLHTHPILPEASHPEEG